MEKASGWDYYLGTAGMNLFCQDPRAGFCKPLPPSQFPSGWVPQIPLRCLWCQARVGAPRSDPHAGWGRLALLGSLFPLEEPEAQERPCLRHRTGLGERHCCAWSALLCRPAAPPLSVLQGVSASHCLLGFSQWHLVLEELLAALFVRESEVRNNLCHHLGDMTPTMFFSFNNDNKI